MPDIAAAIATIEFSRKTHVEWSAWLHAHPEDKRADVAGGAAYQDQAISEYDNVLAVLRQHPDYEHISQGDIDRAREAILARNTEAYH